ncbi:MAG TPA: DinB family protein [Terriglobales bacterium]
MALNQALLPEFDNEMATTRKLLERVPDAKLGWKPHDKSMSMSKLATHLATIGGFVPAILGQDSFDVKNSPPNPDLSSHQEMLGTFDKRTAEARKLIADATDDQLMKPWSLKFEGKTLFTSPRIAVLRSFFMNHSIHHRGQLSVYLRLNNVAVPAMYGPSADENPFG